MNNCKGNFPHYSNFAGEYIDNSKTDFINDNGMEIRQYGDGSINNNAVPKGTPSLGKEFKEKSLFYANRVLNVWFTPSVPAWSHSYMSLDPTDKDDQRGPVAPNYTQIYRPR